MSYRFSGYAESNLVKPSHMRNKTSLPLSLSLSLPPPVHLQNASYQGGGKVLKFYKHASDA